MGKWVGGGVEAVVMNYYRNIDRNKIQFDFICDEDSTYIPYEEIEALGGRVILVPPYQHVIAYHKSLKKVLENGHYAIAHSHINAISVFSLWAARSAGVPVRIAHSHSTTNKHETAKNLFKKVLRPFSRVFATSYMACSELAGRWLFGDKPFNRGLVYVLNNAIDLSRFTFDPSMRMRMRAELGVAEDTLVIGNVGRFVRQKNQFFLLDIFREVRKENPNSLLMLIGQGPLERELRVKARQLGLSDSVLFLGQRDDVQNLYQAMDVFCLPSLYEGFGMVAVEAQVAGLPCVVSREVPCAVDISHHVDFVGLEKSPAVWARHLLAADRSTRNDNAMQARAAGFDIAEESKKLEQYYLNSIHRIQQ